MSPIPHNELYEMPRVVFLFGLAGVGKTFCGELIASRLGYFCYDLDADCTPAMREAISRGLPFTDAMRDEFFLIVCRRIEELKKLHRKLIVMQAVYKERHRALITSRFPDVRMVWVDAPQHLIEERLRSRAGEASVEYANRIRANFEFPVDGPRLVNDTSEPEEISGRFLALFKS
jgi:gluconate kinase